jgi:penicillin amidase
LVLKSTSSDPEQHNLKLLDMMVAKNLGEGIAAASAWYGPSQNVLVADSTGRIGWALSGYLPKRIGFDGKAPVSWAAGDRKWQGTVSRPIVMDPEAGFLSTANNRLVSEAKSRELSRVWVPAWRARRIHELLSAQEKHDLQDLAKIQLDTRDEQYDRIAELVKTDIDVQQSDDVAEAARIIASWNGHADLDSKGLHILKIFTERLRETIFAPLVNPCALADKSFVYNWPLKDEPLFALLRDRPIHLLAPAYATWRGMINQVFKQVVEDIVKETRFGLDTVWGGVRTVYYDHPLGGAPFIGDILNMPSRGMPGDANTPRAQGTRFGASMRLVVSPGEAKQGLFQMPGGQSGHFESDFYGDQHQDWVDGKSTPFAPGESRFRLILKSK